MMIGPKLWPLEGSQAKSLCTTHDSQTHNDRQRPETIAHHELRCSGELKT